MVEFREFSPGDEMRLDLAPEVQAGLAGVDWRAAIRETAQRSAVFTAEHDGRVLGVAGISPLWTNRAVCWCYLSAGIPRTVWPAIHRQVLRVLTAAGVRRIEAETAAGWAPGERWLRLLGFECEGVARMYRADGRDCSRWARIAA